MIGDHKCARAGCSRIEPTSFVGIYFLGRIGLFGDVVDLDFSPWDSSLVLENHHFAGIF